MLSPLEMKAIAAEVARQLRPVIVEAVASTTPRLYTTEEAAELTGFAPKTLRYKAKTGQLSHIKTTTGQYRFRLSDLQTIIS